MKKKAAAIKKFELDSALHRLHKGGLVKSDFGMDNSNELIGGGFGLYSTADLKGDIGPAKTEYYRISLTKAGAVTMDVGLETFHPTQNSIVFGFPGQVFSLYEPSKDFFAYYLLFKEGFIPGSLMMKNSREPFPFLGYTGVQCFQLNKEEVTEVEALILKIDHEIKKRKPGISRIIQLYIQLILLQADRSYERQALAKQETAVHGNALFTRFVKLVSRDFLTRRKVADYAALLHVSSDHLNRTIKSQSKKTAHELINEMILVEAKAHLLRTELSIAEISYQLEFTDPSHFNKFFKKLTGCTPLQYRAKS